MPVMVSVSRQSGRLANRKEIVSKMMLTYYFQRLDGPLSGGLEVRYGV